MDKVVETHGRNFRLQSVCRDQTSANLRRFDLIKGEKGRVHFLVKQKTAFGKLFNLAD